MIIKTEDLTFRYAGQGSDEARPVLSNLDFEIEEGTFTAIIGHNGSGKTTLAKHFNAILLPSGGRVLVDSMDTRNDELLLKIRRRAGMVFQNPDNQIVATVVEEDVAFAPENLGKPPEEIRKRVDEALKITGMYEYRNHAPHLLSGGQKQRVAIAGVLAMNPRCVIFDEPTAMLDPQGRQSVIKIIREMCGSHGITAVLITHFMDEAIEADRVVVMSDGSIIKDGTPRDVFLDTQMLENAGLDIPDTLRLLTMLHDDGYELPKDALSVDECADAIYNWLGNVKNNAGS